MTLYVLTSGEYSDYHIEGIYSTREQAERYKRLFPRDDYYAADIEEWETDKPPVTCVDGNVEVWAIDMYEGGKAIIKEDARPGERLVGGCDFFSSGYRRPKNYVLWISKEVAKDKEQALKIFYDKVAKYKAKEEGIV